ncbi:Acetyltransferase (GNAT) domain-containing protein [Malonomonas rubra DSM 5091]|uniref:Acetyltransferase (GNAT) domain-containing protein n=1 Tax=Malonomonas rubra DSM 5091 TaxID=1122189 RepID=A0A1M6DSG1_MALRU|nr:GNAT family N-acetyltransferase [Malonomonas rubra]SHI75948.1 Acetyltransferase (GNAT) domain-containing protein [Malonomonas rubra DSM 5091]
MSKYFVDYYDSSLEKWDRFVNRANNGTLFHSYAFLKYHGERFLKNEKSVAIYKGEQLFGVMPLGFFEENGKSIGKSPYGASYGGPVFLGPLSYSEASAVCQAIIAFAQRVGLDELRIVLPVASVHREYSETFCLALHENAFELQIRDISSLVPLNKPEEIVAGFKSRARNSMKKARGLGVEVLSRASLDEFWPLLMSTYEKHGTPPTHTYDELAYLTTKLSEKIYFDVARLDGVPVAGICYFVLTPEVNSSFYLAQDSQHQSSQALSLLVGEGLERCAVEGFKWFDFGTSSTGMVGRAPIFKFKESFGAVGLFRETYVWKNK